MSEQLERDMQIIAPERMVLLHAACSHHHC